MKRIFISISIFVFVTCFMFTTGIYCQIDSLVTPKYKTEVITVGGANADIQGFTSEKIQIALDAVKTRGGGVVKLTRGIFLVTAPIEMYSNTSLAGSGKETVLKKSDGVRSGFIIDADGGMLEAKIDQNKNSEKK